MARRRRKSEGSLDSLLDTMTNVVGILVIVLVITKLGVSQAVQRIREKLPDVTVEELATTVEKLEQAKEEEKTWQQRLAIADKPLTDEQVKALWKKIDTLEAEIVKENEVAQAIAQVSPQIKQLETQAQQLATSIQTASTQIETLEQKIASTPKIEKPATKVVSLPNPRAAPANVSPSYFVCKNGRILEVPLDVIFRIAQARLNRLQVKPDKDGKVDCAKVVELFNRAAVTNPAAKASLKVINYRLYLLVEPQPQQGESAEQIVAASSRFSRQLRAMRAQNRYAKFVVWADSYDVYLAARAMMHDAGIAAGWVPYHTNAEWRIIMPDAPICFRPPPKPVEPNPNPPPTPPKPTIPPPPQPKKVPNDDID